MKPENQITYYQEHPPKCIADFSVQPEWLDNVRYDGHGFSGRYPDGLVANPNIVFAVKCRCGNETHRIVAESKHAEIRYHKSLVIAENYFLECSTCHARHLFFDPWLHGYNAETFLLEGISFRDEVESSSANGKHEKITCECSTCKSTTFEVFACIEYPSDLFDMPEFEGKEQEFFSWFSGVGKCNICSAINVFIDYECA